MGEVNNDGKIRFDAVLKLAAEKGGDLPTKRYAAASDFAGQLQCIMTDEPTIVKFFVEENATLIIPINVLSGFSFATAKAVQEDPLLLAIFEDIARDAIGVIGTRIMRSDQGVCVVVPVFFGRNDASVAVDEA